MERGVAILQPLNDSQLPFAMQVLACVRRDLGRHAEAENAFRLALALGEAQDPEHSDVGETLKEYAILLRKMHRDKEADAMAVRARTIHDRSSVR